MIGQNPNDMRTAARRVRGLGSARAGTKEFWHQRVTSVAGIPLTIALIVIVISLLGRSHAAAVVLDQIRVGNIVQRRVPALIVRRGDLRVSLLGMSFLQRLDSFELRGKQMVLRGRR